MRFYKYMGVDWCCPSRERLANRLAGLMRISLSLSAFLSSTFESNFKVPTSFNVNFSIPLWKHLCISCPPLLHAMQHRSPVSRGGGEMRLLGIIQARGGVYLEAL